MQINRDATLAFDVYGTLIDPHALTPVLTDLVGGQAAALSQLWRQKQLEYSFRRGLMRDFVPFSEVTGQALDFALAATGLRLDDADRVHLLDRYRSLDAYPDAAPALRALAQFGVGRQAFSNGDPADIEALLRAQGLWSDLQGAVSVLPVGTFKPDPATYAHFCASTGARPESCWLVSSNPFDVIGALAAGWRAVWIQRDPALPFDTWGAAPTVTLTTLADLPKLIAG